MNLTSIRLPLWLRFVLIAGGVILAAGAGLFGYRYYTRPVTLTVAVGSIDGEAAKAMSTIASRLVTINAPVRLTVIDTGTALAAAKTFASGKADLAVVRGDVGDLSQAQAVVVVSHVVALVIAPPGSSIEDMAGLKGHSVGVISAETNSKLVDVLSNEYGLVRAKVFKDVALADARRALQSKEISALLVVIPLSQKYLSLVRGFFQQGPKTLPVLISIGSAGAIAEADRAYESFDVPKGTLRGAPPVPDDDLTTLRTALYLVANKKLGSDLVTSLTQTIMNVRRDLMVEQPIFAQIAAPSTDADAYLALHPGAAAFYNGTQQSFMDEYGNWIYLTPMILGGMATVLAAAWKFLGIGPFANDGPLDALYALVRRIRSADSEAELGTIEDEIDDILRAQRAKAAAGDESAVDAATLNVAAHRLENLIHDRRQILANGLTVARNG
ncbi:TAXI family TRAP transporter solute-binding subunit [Bradyrhizobium sp. 2S1]|uniref:TAXI family TRAP transporter solute-binding subunit n=1 Tax=Bradyrhizobium sp. 2S1 TaxID=1404429 RepID=UPI001CD11475|nr:TAXI family TRAP transporter solute-binding subunit [Bradyrhizobium sp. 2S1]MCK7671229.1 C4-dicarboxylate ABC transporter substrate-binding protein [Bradyrhizobium sp. 2S1]